MIFVYGVAALVAAFVMGQKIGNRVEKQAVAVALAAFTKAKSVLVAGIARAQTDAKAELERLETLAKKYI